MTRNLNNDARQMAGSRRPNPLALSSAWGMSFAIAWSVGLRSDSFYSAALVGLVMGIVITLMQSYILTRGDGARKSIPIAGGTGILMLTPWTLAIGISTSLGWLLGNSVAAPLGSRILSILFLGLSHVLGGVVGGFLTPLSQERADGIGSILLSAGTWGIGLGLGATLGSLAVGVMPRIFVSIFGFGVDFDLMVAMTWTIGGFLAGFVGSLVGQIGSHTNGRLASTHS